MAEVLLVRAAGRDVALAVGPLVEVLEMPAPLAVPSASPALRGVVQVRGRSLPVFHLGALLKGGACPEERGTVAVIARLKGRLVGLEVEEASEVSRVALSDLPDDHQLSGAIGVIRHDDHFTPVVDLGHLGFQLLETGTMP
jgi:chemotaxis signal transduction protein